MHNYCYALKSIQFYYGQCGNASQQFHCGTELPYGNIHIFLLNSVRQGSSVNNGI